MADKPIFYSWGSYVADILTSNHKHELWKNISLNNNSQSGIVNIPCVFNEVDPRIDKHRRRPIGNKNIENDTVYFCLSHFDSSIVSRSMPVPLICKKSRQVVNCVASKDCLVFDLDKRPLISIWSALPPAYSTEFIHPAKPLIHVHVRDVADGNKVFDNNVEAVVVKSSQLSHGNSLSQDMFGQKFLEIEITPPSAFSLCLAYYKNMRVYSLTCSHCGAWHTDLGIFNITPHKKHLCGSCGYFFDVELTVSCSNALATLPNNWNPANNNHCLASKSILINSVDYDRVDLWAWSPAIAWTMPTPENINGIHIHAYRNGVRVIDETYGFVTFNGHQLRWHDLLIRSIRNCDIPDKEAIVSDLVSYWSGLV